ncbi:hypothetical protein AMECASPLE_019350 [Ameca splendens]|uniref:Uncharacterized protein n=1 Tax=Ameca splendens TaxID=208324 RepID=A0ABV0YPW6_9TELE
MICEKGLMGAAGGPCGVLQGSGRSFLESVCSLNLRRAALEICIAGVEGCQGHQLFTPPFVPPPLHTHTHTHSRGNDKIYRLLQPLPAVNLTSFLVLSADLQSLSS